MSNIIMEDILKSNFWACKMQVTRSMRACKMQVTRSMRAC